MIMGVSTEHKRVAEKATKLIKRLFNCPIGAVEFTGGFSHEHADGICFNYHASFLIEAKVSRADFLADKKKHVRQNTEDGIGDYRYYACPEGLIKPEELPKGWGLIYVPKKGKVTMPVGYGVSVKIGEEKDPNHGWNRDIRFYYGTWETYEKNGEKHFCLNDDIRKSFKFNSNIHLEKQYLYALCSRYKNQNHMENIL